MEEGDIETNSGLVQSPYTRRLSDCVLPVFRAVSCSKLDIMFAFQIYKEKVGRCLSEWLRAPLVEGREEGAGDCQYREKSMSGQVPRCCLSWLEPLKCGWFAVGRRISSFCPLFSGCWLGASFSRIVQFFFFKVVLSRSVCVQLLPGIH